MRAPRLSIVIPAFNERSRLPGTLDELLTYLGAAGWDWEIVIVDDGSSDDTVEVVARYCRQDPRVVLRREPHRGKGAAVKVGMLTARGQYRFICDADLSMPIRELTRFIRAADEGADVAIGVREGEGARRIGEPLARHVVGRIFNTLVQQLLLEGLNDTQCGFKLFTAEAATRVFSRVTIPGWSFDIEVLCLARSHGFRIVEIPIEWHFREHSRVSMVRDGVRMFAEVLRIRRRVRAGAYRPEADDATQPE